MPDLAFRLTAVCFAVPPLRQRKEDLASLAQALLDRICARYKQRPASLGPGVLTRLLQHTWPGNVRELSSTLEAALLDAEYGVIRTEDLPILSQAELCPDPPTRPPHRKLAPRRRHPPPRPIRPRPEPRQQTPRRSPIGHQPLHPLPHPRQRTGVLVPIPCLPVSLFYTHHQRSISLRKLRPVALAACSILLLAVPSSLRAQKLPLSTTPAGPASLQDRRAALKGLFHEYWDAYLEHSPEFASAIGDKRFNDQISDYSVKAENEWLATEQNDLMRLAAIDPTGLTDQEKTSRELLMRKFADDQEAAEFKEWEMPVNQLGGIYSEYPQLVAELSFTTVKDYDDWIARLRAFPQGLRPGDDQHVYRHG